MLCSVENSSVFPAKTMVISYAVVKLLPLQGAKITLMSNDSTAAVLLARSLEEHLQVLKALLASGLADVESSGRIICDALAAGNKILLCGNGGSAADAQHIAAELVGRYEDQRRPFPAIALTTDTSALTALSNDFGYEEVFARQIRALAKPGDVLIAISTSGKSPNIVKAAETARRLGCHTIGLTGVHAEPLADYCFITVSVLSERTARVQ